MIEGFDTADISVGEDQLRVAFADTSDLQRQGLMDVESLPRGIDGMLFVYSEPRSVSFHMLDTPMPLDVWWFDEDGHFLGSAQMEPCLSEPCTNYGSPGPVMWVLETPLGVYDFGLGDGFSTVEND